MSPFVRKALGRVAAMLVGLGLFALAAVWSASHPSRGPVIVAGGSFSHGTTPRGEYQRHSWSIRNAGTRPLKLRTRFTSGRCGFSLWLGVDHVLPVGDSLIVSLSCPTSEHGGIPYSAYANVATDDPDSPRLRFRVIGITQRAESR